MSNETMTVWGFWITIAGTSLSFLSLLVAIFISVNTKKIQKNLTRNHLKEKYRKSKRAIMVQLYTSYELLKDFERMDNSSIHESIISLTIYEDILTRTTKSKLSRLKKKIDNDITNSTVSGKKEVSKLLYEVIKRLENELDEQFQHFKEAIK